jgi:hypothetical protein
VVNHTTELKGNKVASIKQNIVYVGFDVDDREFHGSALAKTPSKSLISNVERQTYQTVLFF